MRQRQSAPFLLVVFILVIYLVLACDSSSAAAQVERIPAIRVKITEVPVEVIVLDSKGKPVLDLRESDFTVLENSVKQKISRFLVERFDEAPKTLTGQQRIDALSRFGATGNRTILIMLGRGRHMWFDTLPVLMEFVENQLRPNDSVAIMAYNRATGFTTDHATLLSVLRRYREQSADIESALELQQTGLQAVYGSRKYGDKLQAQIDSIFELSGSRQIVPQRSPEARASAAEGRESLAVSERQALRDQIAGTENARRAQVGNFPIRSGPDFDSFERLEFRLLTDFGLDDYIYYRAVAEEDLYHLFAAIQYLRFMDGEKHLVFLHNQGLVLSRLMHETSLANVASDARVRLHAVQTGGTWVPSDRTQRGFDGSTGVAEQGTSGVMSTDQIATFRPRGAGGQQTINFALETAEKLAQLTGGLAFSHQGIRPSLNAIDLSSRAAYLLSYRPSLENEDGRFRTIEIQVNRPGLQVLHRRGYYAMAELKPYDRRAFMTHARIAAALEYADSITDMKFTVETQPEPAAEVGKQPFRALVTFVPPADTFQTDNTGLHQGKLAVSYFVLTNKQELLTEAWDDLDMSLKEETFQRVLAGGLRLHKKLTLPAGAKTARLKVVLYDASTDRLGSQEIRVEF